MSENNNENKKKFTNSVLFENEEYNKALALKDAIINEKDETISLLSRQLGQRDQVISEKNKEIETEKTSRVAAESELAQKKELKVEPRTTHYRTEQEKFDADFAKALEKA